MNNIGCFKSPKVLEILEKIESIRKRDNATHVELAKKLYDLTANSSNSDLKSFANCILGDAYCMCDDYYQALYYLSSGIQNLAKTDEHLLIARSYNELGIIYRTQGQFLYSLENFMNAISVAREHRLYLPEAIACENLASLCHEMGALREAVQYHNRVLECCDCIKDDEFKDELLQCVYTLTTKLFLMLEEQDKADNSVANLKRLITKCPHYADRFDVRISLWVYYNKIGNTTETLKYKELCKEAFYSCDDLVTYYEEAVDFVEMMLNDEEYDELEKAFSRMDEKKIDGELINLHMIMAEFKISMYKKIGNAQKMMEAAYQYYEYSSMKNDDSKKSFLTTLHLRLDLEKQKTANIFLTEAAETDALTGLSNRAKLNKVIDELFVMADKDKKRLGVEMMDVDFFKQVNDCYGHSKGDELLSAMGREFKELIDDKIFIARYGGDEFVVYYYDMTDEEILDVALKIQKCIAKIGQELNLENLSVSQGIVNRVPEPLNRAWDYLNSADYALYHVKNNGKAGAALIHKRKDLDNKIIKIVS
ncbi:diguanylate cyclase [Pseudobutyrivibrio sp.]|uniref:diguanylate cyclase n=1 Tax=Pseudobutyrivibrio sp. TaxID=2014367 RepID=UPI001DEBD435|nr:diguanylate cyclase [Pseudobutyrivibrio sp.]MBE5911181.1 GGDEF domain-containing protein [Pseudobutyrivibrio sp.]